MLKRVLLSIISKISILPYPVCKIYHLQSFSQSYTIVINVFLHQITLIFQISSPRTLYISISECNAKIHPKGSLIFGIDSNSHKSITSNKTFLIVEIYSLCMELILNQTKELSEIKYFSHYTHGN